MTSYPRPSPAPVVIPYVIIKKPENLALSTKDECAKVQENNVQLYHFELKRLFFFAEYKYSALENYHLLTTTFLEVLVV